MKAFAITCTTCQKRLRVRDATAIGQILICPHCSSMVLVQPDEPTTATAEQPPSRPTAAAAPPPSATAEAPPVASPTRTAPAPAAELAEPPVASPPVVHPPTAPVEPPLPTTYLASPRSAKSHTHPAREPDPTEPLLPDQSWQSPAVQQRQQWLLLVFAALVGSSLAVGLLGFLAVRMSRHQPPSPSQARVPDTPPEPREMSPSPPSPVDDSERGETQERQEDTASQEDGQKTDDYGDGEAGETQEDRGALETEEDHETDTQQAEQADLADPTEAAGESGREPEQSELADEVSDPDSGQLPLGVETEEPEQPESPEARSLAETLDAFGDLMEDSPFEPAHETPAAEEADPPAVSPRPRPSIRVPQPEAPTIDVAARLDDPISGIELPEVPLLTFIRFMSRMSTIPISLDPDALALLGLDVRTPVRVRMVDGRVQQVLESALEPLRLAPLRVGDQLLVTRPSPAEGALRHHRHPVPDLVGDDPQQLDQLADWILRFVVPESWEAAGGVGRLETDLPALEIHQQDTILFRVLLFCERLRVARELPLTTSLAPEFCRLEPRVDWARQALQQPLHLTQLSPERMANLLEQITERTDVQILVDWPALAEIGWTPAAEMMFQADGQPLGEILAEMLEPLGLTYRVLDAATLQITTPETVYRQWDVAFYRWEPPAEDADQRLADLRDALEAQGLADTEFALQVDPVSQFLIAALPQPYHPRLQAWLAADSDPEP